MGQLIGQNRDSGDEQTTIESALRFLEMAYKTELATEKTFYEKRLLNNKDIPEEYRNKIKSLISADSFDYIQFMSILKEIELGKKQWRKQVAEIKQQAQHFDDALKSYEKLYNKFDMRQQGDEAISSLIGRLYRNPKILYTEENSSMQRALHRSKTFSNAALGSLRSEDSSALIQLINDNFKLICGNHKTQLSLPKKIAFVTEMALQIAQETYSIQEKNESSLLDISVAQQLISLLEQDDTPIQNIHVQNIRKKAEQLFKNLDILEQQGRMIMPDFSERVVYNSKSNSLTGLTKDLRIRLGKILNDKVLEELAHANFTGKDGKKNKEKFIKRLKEAIKKNAGKDEFNKNYIQRLNQAQLADHINEILSTRGRLKISTETEISSARTINDIFSSDWLASKVVAAINGKADSMHIGSIIGEVDIPDSVKQEITNYVMEIYESTYKQTYQETIKTLQSAEYQLPTASKNKTEYKKLFNSTSAYSSYADDIANTRANQAALQALQSRIIDLENISDEIKEKVLDLSSIFKIENSVKYAQYYLNDWGFHGGSLGAALPEQLINFANITQQAGIYNQLDINWLTFAILNAGDGMIGSGNRTAIEDYFSTFASILMFRTGNELAKQVQQNMEHYTVNTTSTMRLYTFQTIYVPSSYILKTTYDALVKAYSLIQSYTTTARGSQVLIINPVNESDKVNSHIYDQRGKAWYETATANFSKVSLEERLMTGFLDVLQQLENCMKGL